MDQEPCNIACQPLQKSIQYPPLKRPLAEHHKDISCPSKMSSNEDYPPEESNTPKQ